MKRILSILCLTLSLIIVFLPNKIVYADELKTSIDEQLSALDLEELELLFENNDDFGFYEKLNKIIDGKYSLSIRDYISNLLSNIFDTFKDNIPFITSVVAIYLILYFFKCFSNDRTDIKNLIVFIFNISVIVILSIKIISAIKDSINTINILARINEVVSPILLTLMVASGGSVSASVFSPTTIFLTSFISTICLKILLPIVLSLFILSIISSFNDGINLGGYTELLTSIFKWIIGIITIIFTIILSLQGISTGVHDGISFKATKFALSNSVPIIGSIVNNGFDFLMASSLLIKNSIGVISIFFVMSVVIKNVISLIVLSLLLKLVNSINIQLNNKNNICIDFSKGITYLLSIIIICGLLLILYIFLIIVSANAFI